MKAIVTVVGKDRVGIIAGVCTALADFNVNVLDISQTVMQGYFTMMMATEVSACNVRWESLSPAWTRSARKWDCPSACSVRTSLKPCTGFEGQAMLNQKDILQTQDMIDKRHLDIRTITMGHQSAGLLRSGFEDLLR